jgi:hypothetical protein
VEKIIENDPNNKKASVLNGKASRLQLTVEEGLEKQLTKIKEKAYNLNLVSGNHLRLTVLYSIPEIKKTFFGFLFHSYEKALNNIRVNAIDWVVDMYDSYVDLLTPMLNEVTEQLEQLLKKRVFLRGANERKVNELRRAVDQDIGRLNDLVTHHSEVLKMWEQDCEHAKQLQGYFIKHWLLYKEELQRKLQYGTTEERWLALHYLLLLQQDDEKIIESLKIRGE